MFEGITGATPHQYLLRVRLRRAALRLRRESTKVVEIALGCGLAMFPTSIARFAPSSA
jgi:AraC-like DNA-binding protein